MAQAMPFLLPVFCAYQSAAGQGGPYRGYLGLVRIACIKWGWDFLPDRQVCLADRDEDGSRSAAKLVEPANPLVVRRGDKAATGLGLG